MLRRLKIALVAVFCLVFAGHAVHAANTSPREVVEVFHGSLLGIMKDSKRLGYAGRYHELSPVIAQAFNLPMMARVVAGRHWSEFTSDQQASLVEAFSRMTTATFASRFKDYSGEKFTVVEEVSVQPNARLVKSQLVKTDGEVVELNYLVRAFEDGWRVVDIYLKGTYSELATRRSEYMSVLDRQGLDGLIRTIDGKVAQLAMTKDS